MSALECTARRRRPLFALAAEIVVTRIKTILHGIRHWHAARVSYRQLQALSDVQLKDIGLHRSQISCAFDSLTDLPRGGRRGEH